MSDDLAEATHAPAFFLTILPFLSFLVILTLRLQEPVVSLP